MSKGGNGDRCECIYLDHNATTPVAPEVLQEMLPYFSQRFGNPSSVHAIGRQAKAGLREARARVAALINASPEEIIFTGCGTESINLALKGTLLPAVGGALGGGGFSNGRSHAITSAVEHHATSHTLDYLSSFGVETTYVPVDRYGMVDPDEVRKAIRPETKLISIMHANNEVGTLQPVEEIATLAGEYGIPFHVDGVQALGKIPVDLCRLGCTFYSMSAHKVYGPKGVGALFIRKGSRPTSILQGGSQEDGLRAGTENVPGIVGFGKACELAREGLTREVEKYWRLRSILLRLVEEVDAVRLNGHREHTLPNSASLAFAHVDGMTLMLNLSLRGICVSTGSACSVRSLKPSHVLLAMGLNEEAAYSSLRFSVGRSNTEGEMERVVEEVKRLVLKLRLVSEARSVGVCGPDCPCYFR